MATWALPCSSVQPSPDPMNDHAPFLRELAHGPDGGHARWCMTSDGIRIRVGYWPRNGAGTKGTVFVFPGRTECVEKYGAGAHDLAARGYATISIDWRGQGLADRMLGDRRIGHVLTFPDYQRDVEAVLAMARAQGVPEPYFVIGHSMGGAIALRTLMGGEDFSAGAFSAPMWGIVLTPFQDVMVKVMGPILKATKLQNTLALGEKAESYLLYQPFEGNLLTSDRDMYQYMTEQVRAWSDLGLGGPSNHWVMEALREGETLQALASPDTPVITFLGTDEQIVRRDRVTERMSRWPNGELVDIPGARHEIPMETPRTREMFYDRTAELFDAQPR